MKTVLFRLTIVAAILDVGSLENWGAAEDDLETQGRRISLEHEGVRVLSTSTATDYWYHQTNANDFASQESDAVEPLWDDVQNQVADGDCLGGHSSLFGPGRGRFFVGAEMLVLRPHFSEATAYILRRDQVTNPNNTTTSSDEWVYFNFDYDVSMRAYFGYRLPDCCSEVRFTYWNLKGGDSKSATTNAAGNVTPTYFVVQPGPNDTLTATSNVRGNIYDLDFSRCIQLGDKCQSCCSCPRWDLRWSAGVRIANMGYDNHVSTNDASDGRLDMVMDYVGAGPKVGLEGRRYFGRVGQFSFYSTLDIALLLGQFDHTMVRTTPPVGVGPTVIETFINNTTRMVPVMEIELGTTWSPSDRLTLSAGWFFQAWWDLGMGEQQTSGPLSTVHYTNDDANIMSWDGITLRAEYQF